MHVNGGEFGLFLGPTICNANCTGCNVGIDHVKATGERPEVYTLPILLNQIEQTFAVAAERGLSKVKLKYAGGEGLYMSRQVAAIQPDLADLSRHYDVLYSQQFLTNGGLIHAYLPILKYIADNHQGESLEINTSIWGIEDNQIRRGSPSLTWPRIQSGLKELEQAGLSWTLHYVMNTDCGNTLLNFVRNSLDPSQPAFFGQDWKKDPLRISVGIMRHETPYTTEQATSTWDAISSVINWLDEATRSGINLASPYRFFDYLLPYVHGDDGIGRVLPTVRTCGTGINFAAAIPSGFARCHELLSDKTKLKTHITDTLLPTSEPDPFSTKLIAGNPDKPIATAIAQAFSGGGCPNDDWVHNPNGKHAEFGPLQYEVYVPTTLALTLLGVLQGKEQALSPVGDYLLQIGEYLAYHDPTSGHSENISQEMLFLSRKLYYEFFSIITDLQPSIADHLDVKVTEQLNLLADNHHVTTDNFKQALAFCCKTWLYTIDKLNKELDNKLYQDITITQEFNELISQVQEISTSL
jgi:sulfatase maturation enzyme AslB (radical SAM superfamily)